MSNTSILSLKEIQNIQIEMMEYIHTVCKSNNINYYIAYGSLLGAIRHSGFIPWDDDIDIWLPRNDYEKLKLFLLQTIQAHICLFQMILTRTLELRYLK